ncbi:MAG: IS982 family transposase, partial [Oscillospiraceae bacterium]
MIELIPIFCDIDDFCKDYEEYCTKSLLMDKNTIIPKTTLSLSEIMTIVVYFHQSKFRNFKSYYKTIILGFLKSYFTKSVSYNRFVELMRYSLIPLLLYTIQYSFGKCSGISFLNSTPIKVCDNHRISSHKVFKDFAKKEHSSTGFFYGFKFHLITNGKGEILSFCLTSGNIDDHDWNVISTLIKEIYVKIFADCGYISSKLFEKLHDENITLVTRIRRNMKNKLMDFQD